MNPTNQGIPPDASLVLHVMRKRGRPRKDPSERRARKAHPQAARVLPGFGQLNSNHPPQVEPVNDATGSMIGQTVAGVVEASFDDGYLLAVRIGNSNTILRGVVFKPGHSAPVTAENDVAPHVQMIRRNTVNFPTGSQTPACGRRRRSREKDMQLVTYVEKEAPPANQVLSSSASKGNYVLAPFVPPVGARGTVVPVVLQPVNLSNGLLTNQPAPHLRALQGKPVHTVPPLAVYPPNGLASQASESQTSSQVTPTGSGNENGPFKQRPEVHQVEEPKSTKTYDVQLKCEPSDFADTNEPLFVEPLQTRHSGHHFQPTPVLRAMEHIGTGRMSQLLQAVQQNMGEDRVPHNGHPTTTSKVGHN